MSSTEPPSRVPPRQQAHETKAARDELSSKGKVEKVREVDADEETRKRRFMKYYKGLDEEEPEVETARPSPFDLYSGKAESTEEGLGVGAMAPSTSNDFDDVEDAVIPGPSYTPPPDVRVMAEEGDEEDEATEGALPQSEDFWVDFDLPDQPIPQTTYSETTGLRAFDGVPEHAQKEGAASKAPISEHRKRVKEIQKKEEGVSLLKGKVEKKEEVHERLEKKKREPSPFGPPGKPIAKEKESALRKQPPIQIKEPQKPPTPPGKTKESAAKEPKEKESVLGGPFHEEKREALSKAAGSKEKKLPTPMEEISKQQLKTPLPREAIPREAAPMARRRETPAIKKVEEETSVMPQEIGAAPVRAEEREGGGGGKKGRDREEKILEIEAPSLPVLPSHIQPMAQAATTQAAPYLSPQTVSLFFQMVGTIFVMTGPQGVNRTEVVLNNPSYANSKFYGATITIEKYATAPDSFNIRLTGSHEAIASFKENIPSLLSAFENANFNFRIGRINVEYTLEKPIFHRKEKGEGKGEAGGGDLRERKK